MDNSLDEIEEGAYEDDEDEEVEYDEDSEEESQQPPASTSATATATITASQTGPRDLSSALRELNVRESYWRPQLAHTNIRDVANADTLRELSGGINCDLVLQLQDNRVLIKPRDPDDEAAISEARERLTTVEADMVCQMQP